MLRSRKAATDNVVWLTGSASGLGLHLTECFVRRGFRVVATDINVEAVQQKAQERMWPEQQLATFRLDVRQQSEWQEILENVARRWGRVDYLFNIAGVIKPGHLYEATAADIDLHMDINVKGVMLGCRTVADHMLRRGSGHIVTIASTAGLSAVPGIGLYSASKFAVRAYSLALADELRPFGVSVTVICPDAIETPMLTRQLDYDEAALTFSGRKTLTVADIERVVFAQVIPQRPLEICLPLERAVLAKAANLVPGVTQYFSRQLKKRGLSELKRRRSKA